MSELDPSFDPNVDPALAEERAHRRRLARSTAVFGAATGVSRVLGLVREIVAAYTFGAAGKINAFTVAFQIPNLVRALVADTALSGAFVPVFSELLEKGERARAWRVASTIFWLVLLLTTGLTAIFVLAAPLIVELFGTPGGDFDLAVGLSRLLFPIVIMLGLSGIVVGILNAYDQFTVPALTPVAWNLVIILGLALGVPAAGGEDAELYVYAGSIVLATLVQLLLPVPWLRGLDGRLRVALDWRDPAVHRFFVLMLPVTLTLGLINVSTLIGTLFASRLIDPDLAPRAIDLAFRLYMLPQGIFSVAVATVLFPTLVASRGARRHGRLRAHRRHRHPPDRVPADPRRARLGGARRADHAARLRARRVHRRQTPVVAGALAAFSVGLVFNGWMLLLNRAFYGLQSNWIPTLVALGNLVLNVILFVALYPVGVWGLPLAMSLSNLAGAVALAILLWRRVGGVEAATTLTALARIIVASVAASVVAVAVWWGLDALVGRGIVGQIVSVGLALGLGTVAYLGASRLARRPRARLAPRAPPRLLTGRTYDRAHGRAALPGPARRPRRLVARTPGACPDAGRGGCSGRLDRVRGRRGRRDARPPSRRRPRRPDMAPRGRPRNAARPAT